MTDIDVQNFYALWDYAKPAESEQRFQAALHTAMQGELQGAQGHALAELRLVLQTQIARTHSLRKQFDAAHALLDALAPQVAKASALVQMHHAIERGRTFNSSGRKAQALPLFERAWSVGKPTAPGAVVPIGQEALAIDAIHMLAIAQTGEQAIATNRSALAYAQAGREERSRRWVGPLLSNIGSELKALGRWDEARASFEQALAPYEERGVAAQTRVVHWHLGHIHRIQGRLFEALAIQERLAREAQLEERPDAYVHEELMLLHAALGRGGEAAQEARAARQLLKDDAWFAAHEAARWAKIEELAR